jgi:malto-oligosyltrehalose trehalohydrolase
MLSIGRMMPGAAADGKRLSSTNCTSALFHAGWNFRFRSRAPRLSGRLGITAVELMPVADFPGRRNWGYDGVYPFAPDSTYGRPEDLKNWFKRPRRGMMVLLDVVYNHFGPEGNYLGLYAPQFFTDRHHTPWGNGINFDGRKPAVRDFFIHNALYWLTEYHFDGLRLDAVHAILDDSTPDILTELAEAVRTPSSRVDTSISSWRTTATSPIIFNERRSAASLGIQRAVE